MPKAITVVQGATAGEDGKIELQYSTALDLGNGRGVNFGSNASVKTGPTAPEWRTALRAKAATDCAVYGASLQAADVTLGDEISKSGEAPPQTRVSVETYGAVGDGVADDTVSIQQALTECSNSGMTCVLTTGKRYRITGKIYLWGRANLFSWSTTSTAFGALAFDTGSIVQQVNFGISGNFAPQEPWSGTIKNIGVSILGSSIVAPSSGRTFYFWRVDGGVIDGVVANFGSYIYSLSTSGNNGGILSSADCIRKNITFRNNKVTATATSVGSEGIGLGSWDGALIENNEILGVGDDVIGIHYSRNIVIRDNDLSSVDGRIYVSNSINVDVHGNTHTRIPRADNGQFAAGVALIYIGHETAATSAYDAPQNTKIHNNVLVLPPGAIDAGPTISIYGARTTYVQGNVVINNASAVTSAGIMFAPWPYSGTWTDPSGLDTTTARIRDIYITGNTLRGAFPQNILQTSGTTGFLDDCVVANNFVKGWALYTDNRMVYGNVSGPPVFVTYSASMTFDASQGSGEFIIPVTNGTAFTINNPVNATGGNQYPKGAKLVVTFVNTSGGAMGAITWGSNFKLAAFTGPATTKNTSITFTNASVYGSANIWREVSRTAADVPN